MTSIDDEIRLHSTPQSTAILALCEPVLEGLGYDCVHLECNAGGKGLLRFYIDKDGGVDVDDCVRASRQLSAVLDVEDPLVESYTLEVSSPGLNRPLGRQSDFKTYIGDTAKITTEAPIEGQRKWLGVLKGMSDNQVSIDVDGVEVRIPFSNIQRANIEYQFEAVQK